MRSSRRLRCKLRFSLSPLLRPERKLILERACNSSNLTVEGSAGKVAPSDSLYTALPADSRAAPAPIDPSSELGCRPSSSLPFADPSALPLQVDKTFFISGQ